IRDEDSEDKTASIPTPPTRPIHLASLERDPKSGIRLSTPLPLMKSHPPKGAAPIVLVPTHLNAANMAQLTVQTDMHHATGPLTSANHPAETVSTSVFTPTSLLPTHFSTTHPPPPKPENGFKRTSLVEN